MTVATRRLLSLALPALVGFAVTFALLLSASAQAVDATAFLPPGFGADDTTAFDVMRYAGALWIAAGVLIVVGGRWLRARLRPGPDHVEPTPGTWRAKLLLVAGVAVAVGAAIVDAAASGGSWGAVASAAAAAAWGVYRAGDDPIKGSKRAAPNVAPETQPAVAGTIGGVS